MKRLLSIVTVTSVLSLGIGINTASASPAVILALAPQVIQLLPQVFQIVGQMFNTTPDVRPESRRSHRSIPDYHGVGH